MGADDDEHEDDGSGPHAAAAASEQQQQVDDSSSTAGGGPGGSQRAGTADASPAPRRGEPEEEDGEAGRRRQRSRSKSPWAALKQPSPAAGSSGDDDDEEPERPWARGLSGRAAPRRGAAAAPQAAEEEGNEEQEEEEEEEDGLSVEQREVAQARRVVSGRKRSPSPWREVSDPAVAAKVVSVAEPEAPPPPDLLPPEEAEELGRQWEELVAAGGGAVEVPDGALTRVEVCINYKPRPGETIKVSEREGPRPPGQRVAVAGGTRGVAEGCLVLLPPPHALCIAAGGQRERVWRRRRHARRRDAPRGRGGVGLPRQAAPGHVPNQGEAGARICARRALPACASRANANSASTRFARPGGVLSARWVRAEGGRGETRQARALLPRCVAPRRQWCAPRSSGRRAGSPGRSARSR